MSPGRTGLYHFRYRAYTVTARSDIFNADAEPQACPQAISAQGNRAARRCGAAGCAEEVMLAHGFTFQQLAELVREGFAVATTERIVGGGQTFEDARFKITGAGRQTLGGQNDGPGA
jgi:hypothetical protein